MTPKRRLLKQQRRWAKSCGLEPDARGYVASVGANLYAPLSPSAHADFERLDGAELNETAARPAKLRALTSSAALVVNVFDFFVRSNPRPLLDALGVATQLRRPPSFELRFPTGLAGHAPNVDVALELESGTVLGIESKFTEWFTPKHGAKALLKDKYFDGGVERWTNSGLPNCQTLAEKLKQRAERFRFLDAAQLLKHALGMATQRPGRFALYYLYFDVGGRAADAHRAEVADFADRVGAELAFKALTYQSVYRSLAARDDVDAHYLAYLGARYFPELMR